VCYALQASSVFEHALAEEEGRESMLNLEQSEYCATSLMHISLTLARGEVKLDDLFPIVVTESVKLINCDRATLFLVHEPTGSDRMLWSKIATGCPPIMVPLKENSIAGATVCKAVVTNIADAYRDIRFDPQVRRVSVTLRSAHCPLPTAHCSLLTAHCSLLTAHCPLLTAHHSLLTAHHSPLTAHHSPLTTIYLYLYLQWDRKSGYRTRSILCVPIVDVQRGGKCIGCLQLINKRDRYGRLGTVLFNKRDVELATNLASVVSIAVKCTDQEQQANASLDLAVGICKRRTGPGTTPNEAAGVGP